METLDDLLGKARNDAPVESLPAQRPPDKSENTLYADEFIQRTLSLHFNI